METENTIPPVVPEAVTETTEKEIKCSECSQSLTKDECVYENDIPYCDSCHDERFFTCYICDNVIDLHESDRNETEDSESVCDSCKDDACFYCESCNSLYRNSNDESHEVNDTTLCQNCFDNEAGSCENCNEYFMSDDLNRCERHEIDYCNDCGHRCGVENPRGASSSHFFGEHKGKTLKIDRLIGVELEAENGDTYNISDEVPSDCGVDEDGSLDDTGVEITTPPASMDRAEDFIKMSCKALTNCNFKATNDCGYHLHINFPEGRHSPKTLARLFRTVYAVEDILFDMLPRSRQNNIYCLELRKNYKFGEFNAKMGIDGFDNHWYKAKDNDDKCKNLNKKEIKEILSGYKHSNHDGAGRRYTALNLHSVFYRGTVEFRYHSGTTDPNKVINWADICLHIVQFVIKRYSEKTVRKLNRTNKIKNKLPMFFRVFNISKKTQEYMKRRIENFNPVLKGVLCAV